MKKRIMIATAIALTIGVGVYAFHQIDYFQASDTEEKTVALEDKEADEQLPSQTKVSSTSEQTFIVVMIPHHEEAVASAKDVLARGATTEEMRTLLEAVIEVQQKEITDMKVWHRSWYGTPYTPDGSYKPTIQDLSSLSGQALDKAFLQALIAHHTNALLMTQQVAPKIEHTEVQTLAENIAETQSAEIVTMRMMLKQMK